MTLPSIKLKHMVTDGKGSGNCFLGGKLLPTKAEGRSGLKMARICSLSMRMKNNERCGTGREKSSGKGNEDSDQQQRETLRDVKGRVRGGKGWVTEREEVGVIGWGRKSKGDNHPQNEIDWQNSARCIQREGGRGKGRPITAGP